MRKLPRPDGWLEEVLTLVAMICLAVGGWQAWRPAAFLVPGAVLLWIALPTRRGFIESPPPAEKPDRRKG